MRKDAAFGVLLGAGLTAISAAANVQRGDPHLVSVYPDVLSLLVLPLVIFEATRRHARAGATRDAAASYGVRVSLIAAAVFAVGISSFSLFWLASHSLRLAGLVLAMTFVLTSTVGYAASRWGSSGARQTWPRHT